MAKSTSDSVSTPTPNIPKDIQSRSNKSSASYSGGLAGKMLKGTEIMTSGVKSFVSQVKKMKP
jgi:hypothetical protein